MQRESQANKSILYLSYDGLTDPLGQSQILPYLFGLSSMYFITIVSFEKPDRYKEANVEIRKKLLTNGIDWHPLKYHKSPPILSTVYDLIKLQRLAARLHQQKSFNVIHCRSYLPSLIGLRLKRKMNTKFIFDMRGFWADERVEGGLWNLANPIFRNIYSFFKRKEREFIRHADHTISLTENAKEEILSWGIQHSPLTVIPTCVDLDFFVALASEQKQNELRRELRIDNETPVLLYLGSWGTWYMTNEMVGFYQRLKGKVPNLIFLIVTQDQVILPEGIQDVLIRKANREDVPNYIALAWASIFFIMPSYSKKASSATKMAEILSMGVPIITNSGWGDIDRFKKKFHNLVVREDPLAEEIVKKWITNRQMRQSNDLSEMSLEFGVEQYRKVYQSILPG